MQSPNESLEFVVSEAEWDVESEAILSVREAVFILEQQVAREIDVDGSDVNCRHVLVRDKVGTPIGTARLDREGHVGRVAVLAEWRNNGVGRLLMDAVISLAERKGFERVELNSQTHAAGFYESIGFVVEGEEFEEAGIPHVKMLKDL